ncbi:endonuclease III [Lichenibacterium ramalinae]|nr:endonuclease III [Lichenibacterium ramalinae]
MARKKTPIPPAPPVADLGAPGSTHPVAEGRLDAAPEHEAGRIRAVFSRLRDAEPAPKTELVYRDPFTLLVAVVLSAQATDVSVNKATGPLFAVADTPQAILALGEDRLRDFVKTIGLYNAKAKNVMALCALLVERHGGAVPRERAALETLPGVGRKTANVVLNTIWGDPVIAVDTHVFRVSNRLAIAPGATPLAVELGLERAIPAEFMRDAHHWMILHGRYTCLARKPLCPTCPVSDLCPWPEKRP